MTVVLCAPASAGPTGVPSRLPDGLASESERLVAMTLGNPATANFRKFGGFRLSDGGWAVCGEVNSRNLAGLAMGWKPIYLRYRAEGNSLKLARRIIDWPADVACRHLASGKALHTRD